MTASSAPPCQQISIGDADAMDEILEARVGAQWVELRIARVPWPLFI